MRKMASKYPKILYAERNLSATRLEDPTIIKYEYLNYVLQLITKKLKSVLIWKQMRSVVFIKKNCIYNSPCVKQNIYW